MTKEFKYFIDIDQPHSEKKNFCDFLKSPIKNINSPFIDQYLVDKHQINSPNFNNLYNSQNLPFKPWFTESPLHSMRSQNNLFRSGYNNLNFNSNLNFANIPLDTHMNEIEQEHKNSMVNQKEKDLKVEKIDLDIQTSLKMRNLKIYKSDNYFLLMKKIRQNFYDDDSIEGSGLSLNRSKSRKFTVDNFNMIKDFPKEFYCDKNLRKDYINKFGDEYTDKNHKKISIFNRNRSSGLSNFNYSSFIPDNFNRNLSNTIKSNSENNKIRLNSQILFKNTPSQIKLKCNCKKSQCLKFYCECLSTGDYCKDCNCENCENVPNNNKREEIVNQLKQKKDQIIKSDISTTLQGCNCTKTFCAKKYCECFGNGKKCNENCRCSQCKNSKPVHDFHQLVYQNIPHNDSKIQEIIMKPDFNISNVVSLNSNSLRSSLYQIEKVSICVESNKITVDHFHDKKNTNVEENLIGNLKKRARKRECSVSEGKKNKKFEENYISPNSKKLRNRGKNSISQRKTADQTDQKIIKSTRVSKLKEKGVFKKLNLADSEKVAFNNIN